jgi:hypothetical protein
MLHSRHARRAVAVGLTAALTTALAACQSAPRRRGDDGNAPSSTGSRVITRETIAQWNVLDAYAVIERAGGYRIATNNTGGVAIRQRRGQSTVANSNADRPVLVIDGTLMSDYDLLRRIRANEIERIEFLSPTDATQKYGTTSSGAGAIIVVTKSRP